MILSIIFFSKVTNRLGGNLKPVPSQYHSSGLPILSNQSSLYWEGPHEGFQSATYHHEINSFPWNMMLTGRPFPTLVGKNLNLNPPMDSDPHSLSNMSNL